MARDNPGWRDLDAVAGPDGDADLDDADFDAFHVPPCPACGGMLKPDVVFFGETVPRERVEQAHAALGTRGADAKVAEFEAAVVRLHAYNEANRQG